VLKQVGDEVRVIQEMRGRLLELDASPGALDTPVLHIAEAAPQAPPVAIPSFLRQEVSEAAMHTRWHLELLSDAMSEVREAVGSQQNTLAAHSVRPDHQGRVEGANVDCSPILESGDSILGQASDLLELPNSAELATRSQDLLRSFMPFLFVCRGYKVPSSQDAASAAQGLKKARQALKATVRLQSPSCARLLWEGIFQGIHRAYQMRVAAARLGLPFPLAMGMAPGTCNRNPAACTGLSQPPSRRPL